MPASIPRLRGDRLFEPPAFGGLLRMRFVSFGKPSHLILNPAVGRVDFMLSADRNPSPFREQDRLARGGADADGLLLVELQTVGKPLRFSITVADAFQVAEKLVKTAMGAQD